MITGADRRHAVLDHDRRRADRPRAGDIEGEDATITQSYDSAAALARGELSPVTAFMTGKLKIAGNMGMILGLQGALAQLPAAMAKIDVEY